MDAAQVGFWSVVALVVLALAFDFMNGFHDAANSIATVVSTGVLKPLHAVVFAGVCNVIAIFVFKLTVAATVAFIFVSPLLGFTLGSVLMVVVAWVCRRTSPLRVDNVFRRLQLVSAGLYSLGHGGNDAQKTIGIIWMLLIATGYASAQDSMPPFWTILSCYVAIAAGTLMGGWRIVKTMGQKITKLKPVGGFCAETSGGITLLLTAFLGISVSTTHTITAAIMGVGATKRLSGVRWGLAGNIILAWILTIPASAIVGAITYHVVLWFV